MPQWTLRGLARWSDWLGQHVTMTGRALAGTPRDWSTAELIELGDRVVLVGRAPRHGARHRGSLPAWEPLCAPLALLLAVADRLRRRHFAAPSPAARAGVRDAIVLTAAAGTCLALSITGAAVAMGTL